MSKHSITRYNVEVEVLPQIMNLEGGETLTISCFSAYNENAGGYLREITIRKSARTSGGYSSVKPAKKRNYRKTYSSRYY